MNYFLKLFGGETCDFDCRYPETTASAKSVLTMTNREWPMTVNSVFVVLFWVRDVAIERLSSEGQPTDRSMRSLRRGRL
jgi:hypothetical protein